MTFQARIQQSILFGAPKNVYTLVHKNNTGLRSTSRLGEVREEAGSHRGHTGRAEEMEG